MYRDADERFWDKVEKVESGCWNWMAANVNGYGQFWLNGRKVLAHRYAYESLVGGIPKGLEPDHLCRNPSCVNPRHIELVTHRENNRRGLTGQTRGQQQLAKTHCPQGHPYDEENTYIYPNGRRECRICSRGRLRGWRAKKKLGVNNGS